MIDREDVVSAMHSAADVVALHGPLYLPIYHRLETVLDDLDLEAMAMVRALKLAGKQVGAGQGTPNRNRQRSP